MYNVERDSRAKTIKNNSNPREQDRKVSQNNKKLLENVAAGGFGFLEGILNCYFRIKNIQIR